jgi:mannose-6-phosphate isomerase-like protein (cupin superfamily)
MSTPAANFLDSIDKSGFTTESSSRVVLKPWGRELLLTADSDTYTMKVIEINAGARLSLQAHDQKTESWTLLKGRAGVMMEDATGELKEIELTYGVGYTTKLGQRHRLYGITDCAVLEASTPELGTTLRLEDDYARPDETEAMRLEPNRGFVA